MIALWFPEICAELSRNLSEPALWMAKLSASTNMATRNFDFFNRDFID